jgi:ribonucleotide reductase alpha subunit
MSNSLDSYQSYIHLSKYSRWIDSKKSRETWEETVDRYITFMFDDHLKCVLGEEDKKHCKDYILNMKTMPSMRALMSAGKALSKCNVLSYNCSYLAIDHPHAFDEIMYILMSAAGVGFSVESKYIDKLPTIAENFHKSESIIVVPDSTIGWASSFRELISLLYTGKIPNIDYNKVRVAGSILKTKGGRSSGPEPLKKLFEWTIKLFKNAAGRKLNTLECHDLVCKIAEIVIVGASRRAALISLSDLTDYRLRDCKSGQWWIGDPHRAYSNNSAVYDGTPDIGIFLEEWKALYDSKSGERGIFNRAAAVKKGKEGRRIDPDKAEYSCNPCVTGDTLVAVADGRGTVSIKQLAEEGDDVPVYSVNKDGIVEIKMGRNPRITGYDKELLEVVLDDDSTIKVTLNHKFLLRDGTVKEAHELKRGDSLQRFSKKAQSFNKDGKLYNIIKTNIHGGESPGDREAEHRLIAKFYQSESWIRLYNDAKLNGWCKGGVVVHHKDHNGQNNTPDNLQLMTFKDHCELHASFDTQGEKNGKYCGVDNNELINYGIKLCKKLGRRFSRKEWVEYAAENNLPQSFSAFRKKELGNTLEFALKCANLAGFNENQEIDSRTLRSYGNAIDSGYDAFIENDVVMINRNCENCGKVFTTKYKHREISNCSHECGFKLTEDKYKEKRLTAIRCAQSNIRENSKKQQLDIYLNMKMDANGTDPMKKEWEIKCKQSSVTFRMGSPGSPFKSYKDLKKYASTYNHRVKEVRKLNYKDTVYNITVDDNHTVAYVTKSCTNGACSGIFTLNCGEILLRPAGVCNLSEVIVREDDTRETLLEKVRVATILGTIQSSLTNFKYLRKIWKKNAEEERLLGVSLSGIMDNPLMYDISTPKKKENLKNLLIEMREYAVQVNKEYAEKIGINPSTAITTGKPSGNVSQLVNCSSGIHPRFSKYYRRSVRSANIDPITQFLKDRGVYNEPDNANKSESTVFYFPIKSPDHCKTADDVTAIEQLELWKMYRTHWCEHNQSITVYIREHEWIEVAAWVYKNMDDICGVSFLPYSDNIYEQAPYTPISEEEYNKLVEEFPKELNYSELSAYEAEDYTTSAQEFSCVGDKCELK